MTYKLELTEDEIIALHRLVIGTYLYKWHKESLETIRAKIESLKPVEGGRMTYPDAR